MDFNSAKNGVFTRRIRENLMREAHFDTAYVVELLDLFKAEMCIKEPSLFSSCSRCAMQPLVLSRFMRLEGSFGV
jgi:hypothetical protein